MTDLDARVVKLAEAMAKADTPAGDGIYAKVPSIYLNKARLALSCIDADPKAYGFRPELTRSEDSALSDYWFGENSAVQPNV